MNYVKAKLNWEEVFIQEAIDLEEKMISLDSATFSKSRIRLALENDILSWKKYQLWLTTELQCASLSASLTDDHLENLITSATSTLEIFSEHTFWSEDLIPIDMWDENLVVIGLERNENLNQIPKCIFVLASPEVLGQFSGRIFNVGENTASSAAEDPSEVDSKIDLDAMLDGIDINASAPNLQFSSATLKESLNQPVAESKVEEIKTTEDEEQTDKVALDLSIKFNEVSEISKHGVTNSGLPAIPSSMWDYISERHDEYCFEVKKQFDAYMVLRINNKRTQIFKMDSDLANQELNPQLFEYSLDDENPFKKVLTNGYSESFNISQLGFAILDYKYACITPLKRSNITVGFLVGLKTSNLAETDQSLLEDLAKESA